MWKITLAILFLESIANNFHGLTNGYSNTSVRDTGINNPLCNLKSRFRSIARQHYCLKIYYFMVCSLCKSFTKKHGRGKYIEGWWWKWILESHNIISNTGTISPSPPWQVTWPISRLYCCSPFGSFRQNSWYKPCELQSDPPPTHPPPNQSSEALRNIRANS